MHLLENYALQTGLKIRKPFIQQKFFPLDTPYDKVVLMHAFAGGISNNQAVFPSKIYDYYNEVIEQLTPFLQKYGYVIYQIGGPGEPPLRGVNHLMGQTTLQQTAFLIQNCALLIGNDSINSHMASAFGTPSVILFGPTSPREHGAYWKTNKNIAIESHRFGNRPSFSAYENPKTINVIPPEEIVNNVLSVLNLEERTLVKSYFIGEGYSSAVFEIVPNCMVHPDVLKGAPAVVRMDLCFNPGMLFKLLQQRKCQIVTRKLIKSDFLKQFKENILSIVVYADDIVPDDVADLKKLGVPYSIITENQDSLNDLRFKFYDFGNIEIISRPTKKDFIELSRRYTNTDFKSDLNTLKLKTNKFIFSEGKVYLSQAHLEADKPNDPSQENFAFVIDSPTFWKDLNHFYIFE